MLTKTLPLLKAILAEYHFIYPDSIPMLGQLWPNYGTSVGPAVAQRQQATGKNYIQCLASVNQIMFTNNFFSVNL